MQPANIKQAMVWAFFATALALVALAAATIAGALLLAAMLPRGHHAADRLRAFAARVPGMIVHALGHLYGLIFLLFLCCVFWWVALTFMHS
ncbi:MAG TPA: hypothetical protein VJ766_06305 [Pseudoxanthomonas sp.]|nr:hypothetical protein [Pseudoxanthomonas sp.]